MLNSIVATPPKAPQIPTAPPVAQAAAAQAALPPLQDRTPEQLKDGLVVKVSGAGSGDLAVARLIQDGAQYVAQQAGTTMGLGEVTINDASADAQGALGLATFKGNTGWFGLSKRSTAGLLQGITRLRTTPFDQWKEAERASFVQANAAVLHEAGHVTLPAYDSAQVNAWRRADRPFEEGLTEIATMSELPGFLKDEFNVDIPPLTQRIQESTSAYTRYTERIERMIEMATPTGAPAERDALARRYADNTVADKRIQVLASDIATQLGGPTAPKVVADEIAKTIPGFIAEENGTRTRLMELQSALVDHKAAGTPFDEAAFIARLADVDAQIAAQAKQATA